MKNLFDKNLKRKQAFGLRMAGGGSLQKLGEFLAPAMPVNTQPVEMPTSTAKAPSMANGLRSLGQFLQPAMPVSAQPVEMPTNTGPSLGEAIGSAMKGLGTFLQPAITPPMPEAQPLNTFPATRPGTLPVMSGRPMPGSGQPLPSTASVPPRAAIGGGSLHGEVDGPGGPRDDRVGPVMLSNREYILPEKTYRALKKEKGGKAGVDRWVQRTNDGIAPHGLRDGGMAAGGKRVPLNAAEFVGAGAPVQTKTAQMAADAGRTAINAAELGAAADPWPRGLQPPPPTPADPPKPPGLVGRGLRAIGRVAGPIAGAAVAADTATTSTERAAERTGVNPENKTLGAGMDLGMRSAPVVGPIYNALVPPGADAQRLGGDIAARGAYAADGMLGHLPSSLLNPEQPDAVKPAVAPAPAAAANVPAPGLAVPPVAAAPAAAEPPAGNGLTTGVSPDGMRMAITNVGADGQFPAQPRTVQSVEGRQAQLRAAYAPTQYNAEASSTPSLRTSDLHAGDGLIDAGTGDGRRVPIASIEGRLAQKAVDRQTRLGLARDQVVTQAETQRRGQDMLADSAAARDAVTARGQDIDAANQGLRAQSEARRAEAEAARAARQEKLDANKAEAEGVEQTQKAFDRMATVDTPILDAKGKPTGRTEQKVDSALRNTMEDFYRRKGGYEKLSPVERDKVALEAKDAWKINRALQASGTKNNWFGDLFGDEQTNPGNTDVLVTKIGPAGTIKKAGINGASVFERDATPYIHTKHGGIIPLKVIAQDGEASKAFADMLKRQGKTDLLKQYTELTKGK